MTLSAPVVSVLMTAYNRADHVGEAIESVLRSSMSDLELIVVDDASADQTATVAAGFESDPRVRTFVNPTNLGDYANRNQAASYARGKYIKYLDSDDIIYPYGLEVMVRCMNGFPEAGLGISAFPDASVPYPRLLSSAEAYRENYSGKDTLSRAPGSTIIRRDAFESVGGFSGVRDVGDHELWLRIARRFPVVKMPRDLVWDRTLENQEKHQHLVVDSAVANDRVRVAALMADDCPLPAGERASTLERMKVLRAQQFWTLVRNGSGFSAARDFRNRVAIPLGTIANTGFETLRTRVFGGDK